MKTTLTHHLLAALSLCESGTKPIRCSIVMAARDEGARIEQTIRHWLAQRDICWRDTFFPRGTLREGTVR